jgi:hypothetical protein
MEGVPTSLYGSSAEAQGAAMVVVDSVDMLPSHDLRGTGSSVEDICSVILVRSGLNGL